jgi:hypothetical protein
VDERVRNTEQYRPQAVQPVAVDVWFSQFGTVDHRRVLAALVRQLDGAIRKRHLQQLLHRLPAVTLNRALDSLIGAGFLVRDGACIALCHDIRPVLLRPGVLVNQRVAPRAQASQRRQARAVKRGVRRLRRPLPPRGTSAWGRSMLAKRGGYVAAAAGSGAGQQSDREGHTRACGKTAATESRSPAGSRQQGRRPADVAQSAGHYAHPTESSPASGGEGTTVFRHGNQGFRRHRR